MAYDAVSGSQYVITSKSQGGVVQQTRTKAASAVVLARKWMIAGYTDIQIEDPLGKIISPDGYRGAIMYGSRIRRLARSEPMSLRN